MAKILDNKEDFETNVINSSVPVLVDFFATWCGPCKMISPVIDELAEELTGKAGVFKVDSDQYKDVCVEYSIKNLPTMLIFKNGEEVDRVVGVTDKEVLIQKLESFM